MKLRSTLLLIPLAAALATAAPAQADDASVFAAYSAHSDSIEQGVAAYHKAIKVLIKHHGFRNDAEAQAVIDADALMNAGVQTILDGIKAQQPSTDIGAKAKKLSLREGMIWIKANDVEMQGLREAMDGRNHRADLLYRKATQGLHRYQRTRTQARRAWKQAGFKPPKWGIGT